MNVAVKRTHVHEAHKASLCVPLVHPHHPCFLENTLKYFTEALLDHLWSPGLFISFNITENRCLPFQHLHHINIFLSKHGQRAWEVMVWWGISNFSFLHWPDLSLSLSLLLSPSLTVLQASPLPSVLRSLICPSWWQPSTAWWGWQLFSPALLSTWSSIPTWTPTQPLECWRLWPTWAPTLEGSRSVAPWWPMASFKVGNIVLDFEQRALGWSRSTEKARKGQSSTSKSIRPYTVGLFASRQSLMSN